VERPANFSAQRGLWGVVVAAAVIGTFRAFVAVAARRPPQEWPDQADRAFNHLSSGLGQFGVDAGPTQDSRC
jgi:hypothetical protein